jgi:hypothetical protein
MHSSFYSSMSWSVVERGMRKMDDAYNVHETIEYIGRCVNYMFDLH